MCQNRIIISLFLVANPSEGFRLSPGQSHIKKKKKKNVVDAIPEQPQASRVHLWTQNSG